MIYSYEEVFKKLWMKQSWKHNSYLMVVRKFSLGGLDVKEQKIIEGASFNA